MRKVVKNLKNFFNFIGLNREKILQVGKSSLKIFCKKESKSYAFFIMKKFVRVIELKLFNFYALNFLWKLLFK